MVHTFYNSLKILRLTRPYNWGFRRYINKLCRPLHWVNKRFFTSANILDENSFAFLNGLRKSNALKRKQCSNATHGKCKALHKYITNIEGSHIA